MSGTYVSDFADYGPGEFLGFLRRERELIVANTFGAPLSPAEARRIFEMLDIGAAPESETQPVESELPALVLSGGMDLDTSFEWGALAASRLPNARHLVFPFAGHMVAIKDPCARDIAVQFRKDPLASLDVACLEAQRERSQKLVMSASDVVAAIEQDLPREDRSP